MKIAFMYFGVLSSLITSFMIQVTQAEPIFTKEEAIHATAHAGASYILTHATEVVCTKIAGKEHRLACTLVGVGVAATAGIAKEVLIDKCENNRRHAIGYAEDASGIVAAVTIISIDW